MPQDNKRLLLILAPLAMITLAMIVAVSMVKSKPELQSRPAEIIAPLVETMALKFEDVQVSVKSQGTVEAKQQTQLISEVTGRVIWVSENFKNGNFISKDEELLHIDALDYELALAVATANLHDAELNLMEEKVRAKQAESDWELAQKLKPQADKEASALTLRLPHLARAKATLEANKAQLKLAKRNLQRTRLTASFNGIVENKSVDVGQYLILASPIATLLSSEQAEVRLPISLHDLSRLDNSGLNATVEVTLFDAMLDQKWPALISRIEKKLDPETREQYLIANIQDPYNLDNKHPSPLSLGAFVDASISGKTYKRVIKIPRHALHQNNHVFVVGDSNTLVSKAIEFVRLDDKNLLVIKGLSQGEKLVLTQLPLMTEGMKIRVATEKKNSQETL